MTRTATLDWSQVQGVILLGEPPGEALSALIAASRQHRFLIGGFDSKLLAAGAALAVEETPDQPDIYLNVTAVQDCGGVYDKQVLRLVKHLIWN